MTDLQHGLRVDPTRWTLAQELSRRPGFQWQAVVVEHRRQRTVRYTIAQFLRRLATWVEPR